MSKKTLSLQKLTLSLCCGIAAFTPSARAETAPEIDLNDLGRFDLETLLNLEVTSASKKQERLSESPTAIYVITQEDIRRSGTTTLPELFRMVPGMQVARVNASQWAISARGFNDSYADKLLVLVDGRTVYTPSFGGVFWVDQDLVLEDLDRIEVIRGPGATLWGANAVNGVINVITKKARDTQGLLLSTAYGTFEQPSTSFRYGGALSDTLHYRIFGKYFNHDNFENAAGETLGDDWQIGSGGFRLDWEPGDKDLYTLQAGYFNGQIGEIYKHPQLTPPYEVLETTDNNNRGGHVLGRWTHTLSEGSEFSIQTYYDKTVHREFGVEVEQETFDLEWQHRFHIGERNEIIWGAGYRYFPDDISRSQSIQWTDYDTHHQLLSSFAQDELTLVEDRLKFTFGSKFEHNDYTGLEIQPSARLLYTPTSRQSLWASVSRAVRTPTRSDIGLVGDFQAFPTGPDTPPAVVRTLGNPDFQSEEVFAYELGYRIRPHDRLSIDLSGFYNVLDGFRQFVPGDPFFEASPGPAHVVQTTLASNGYNGNSYGLELSLEWAPLDNLRFHAAYTTMETDLDPDDLPTLSTPEQQFHLRSYLDLPHSIQLMGSISYVNPISPSDGLVNVEIPAYIRSDLGITWRPTKNLELGVWGQNLLDPAHPEFTNYRSPTIAEIPRSILGKITISY